MDQGDAPQAGVQLELGTVRREAQRQDAQTQHGADATEPRGALEFKVRLLCVFKQSVDARVGCCQRGTHVCLLLQAAIC